MEHRSYRFLAIFAFLALFAAVMLGLVYVAMPSLDALILTTQTNAALQQGRPQDVFLAVLGSPQRLVFGGAVMFILCSIFASFATSVYMRRERISGHLREQLFSAYATTAQAQRESEQLRKLLDQASMHIRQLTERLRKLEHATSTTEALDTREYATTQETKNPALEALQHVSDELEQASESVREMVPSAHSLEHSLTPLSLRAKAAADALTLLQRTITRLNRLAINAALEATRLGNSSHGFVGLSHEFQSLSRTTAEQAATVGEQLWHLKEILSAASSPLSAIVTDAETTLTHLTEASELIDIQWGRLASTPHDASLAQAVAEAVRQAETLESTVNRALVERKAA